MPNPSLRPWTEEDKANLSLAGKLSQEIAAPIGQKLGSHCGGGFETQNFAPAPRSPPGAGQGQVGTGT
jgi:hypothetical protein